MRIEEIISMLENKIIETEKKVEKLREQKIFDTEDILNEKYMYKELIKIFIEESINRTFKIETDYNIKRKNMFSRIFELRAMKYENADNVALVYETVLKMSMSNSQYVKLYNLYLMKNI